MNLEVLPDATKKLFDWLQTEDFISKFILAGGTGLALQYGHRQSDDLDFFSSREFNQQLLKNALKPFGIWEGFKEEEGTMVGAVENVKISFIHLDTTVLKEPAVVGTLRIASPLDIALMKILAIANRGTKRDFIDLFFLCQRLMSLPDLMRYFPKKYDENRYNLQHVIRSVGYFVDAEAQPLPRMIESVSWDEVKVFFHDAAERLAKEYL